MPSDEIAVMNPMIHELKLSLIDSDDWCVGFTLETNEDIWIQITGGLVNISMCEGVLKPEGIVDLFKQNGLTAKITACEPKVYLTLEVNWIEDTTQFTKALDEVFISHFKQAKEYPLDCEIYEI
ncbi:MAG: hypothetical protein NE327_06490 [Lentisphaeraceae bacterium]|nr:hypothetical protein [Lentisphaeraceae bacterium]